MADIRVKVDTQNITKVRVGQQNSNKVVSSVSGAAGGYAVSAENIIGGIASVRSLFVSGVSTFIGIGTFKNDLFVGGNLFATSANFSLDRFTVNEGTVTGSLSVKNIDVSGISSTYNLRVLNDASVLGITTLRNLDVDLNAKFTGVSTFFGFIDAKNYISAQEYYGPLRFGQPEGGFKPGAIEIDENDYTKNSINDINFILGKLVPKPPTTILNASFTILNLGSGLLCGGFIPINNTSGVYTVTPGVSYPRNTSNLVTSSWLTQYGPGDKGEVSAMINFASVGSRLMTSNDVINPDNSITNDALSDNGVYGSLEIANDKDAFFSTRNPGIASDFYEIYDARIINASSPDGFNMAYIKHQVDANTFETQKYLYYEDLSTVTAPVLTASTPVTPPSPTLSYSSGVPHYTQSSNNAFNYQITCQNATGDMYSNFTFLTSSGPTSGFQNGGNKSYTDFTGGTNPPTRNFGVGSGVVCSVSQVPRDLHIRLTSSTQKFSLYTATTPYGTGNVRATISEIINVMGTTARTDVIDEDNILITTLGTGSGNARRVNAGSTGDNPIPVFTSWVASSPIESYESTVVGGLLRHDQTNYSVGHLPVGGPNYSSGRSGAQYFQLEMIRSNVSEFLIIINGTYSGCWVCMPNNSAWTTSLSGTNGWANMFQAYRGSGIPTSALPGCAFAGNMTGNSGTFRCVFGTESSSNDSNNRILVRFRMNTGNQINTLSFKNT